MEIKPQTQKLLAALNEGVYEKQEAIALTLLTAIAGESIFLLGAPGVAKSLIARRLKFAFKEAKAFEYLMNRFSTPEEIFGPVSISKLKEDKYERIVDNYLPTATVVFLDEIWKAGPSIQNALLTILNEKIYRNGDVIIDPVPIKALISASNELPMKGEGLEALWDRFLVRFEVGGVIEKINFNAMISNSLKPLDPNVAEDIKLTNEKYHQISKLIDEVTIPDNVFNVIDVIRHYLNQHNQKEDNIENQIYVSDRRWKKIVRLLRTSAFLNDRTTVDLMDCFLISHCLWNETEQIPIVGQFVRDAIQKHGYTKSLSQDLTDIVSELKEFDEDVKRETSFLKPTQWERLTPYYDKYYKIPSLKIDYYDPDYVLIAESDYIKLSSEPLVLRIYKNDSRDHYRNNYYKTISLKLGKNDFTVVHDGKAYKLETKEIEVKELYTKRPHDAVKKEWDKKASLLLTTTGNLTTQLDTYKSNDLKHLRVNLFVDPGKAEIVESNLTDLQNEIKKLEIEARGIKHYYDGIKGQKKIQLPPLAITDGAKPKKDFTLDLLSEMDVEDWVIDELRDHDVVTAKDFIGADMRVLASNTSIDENTLLDISQKIDTKLAEIA